MDEEMTLYDLNQIPMKELINALIEDGFITSSSELGSYINTLKNYLGFLKMKHPIYKASYEEILEIYQNIFLYLNKIQDMGTPFNIDKNISYRIGSALNEQALDFIVDFEKFTLYIINESVEVTKKRKHIKRNALLELNGIMENEEPIDSKAPNQVDFPMLNFFYIFALDNELIKLDGDYLIATKKASQYLWLNDEDKYTLFLQYIWEDKFMYGIDPLKEGRNMEIFRKNLLNLMVSLEENTNYSYSTLLPMGWGKSDFLLEYYSYLEMIGLLRYNFYPEMGIEITSLGKILFKSLGNDEDDYGKIISIEKINNPCVYGYTLLI
jgi:hypothetical protein